MKKRHITAIFAALTLALCSTVITGCAGREYRTDGEPVAESSMPAVTESSEEESSEEESSEEESSEEESSEEESSEEESSEEESSEENESGIKITFVKPDGWGDNIKAYVYNDDQVKNAEWPGLDMTDNGDGTYFYIVPDNIENPLIIFSDPSNKRNQYPRAGGLEIIDGKIYEVE